MTETSSITSNSDEAIEIRSKLYGKQKYIKRQRQEIRKKTNKGWTNKQRYSQTITRTLQIYVIYLLQLDRQTQGRSVCQMHIVMGNFHNINQISIFHRNKENNVSPNKASTAP